MLSAVEIEMILKLVIAAALGALIGLERELSRKPAGMRTHALVCLGAAMFAIVSVAVNNYLIAAGVVTGIGFIGAGVIWHSKNKAHGLTTAADMWTIAAIGLIVGIGLYLLAIVGVALMLFLLVPGRIIEGAMKRKR